MDFWLQLLDTVSEDKFLEHTGCPACQSSLPLKDQANSIRDRVISQLGPTLLKRCRNCELVYSSPRLSSQIRDGMYRRNPGSMTSELNATLEPLMDRRVASMLKEMLASSDFNSLFEVGSGWGHFLSASKKYFKNVSGVELSQEQAAYARERFGLEISEQDIFLSTSDLSYDVIAAWELLEHLPNPSQFIAWAHSRLNSGGQLILSTPNYSSLYRRILGTHWFYFIPSQHLTYFSPHTLRVLLQKAGFTQIKICTSGRSLFRERWNSHNQIDLRANQKQQWLKALRIRDEIEQMRDVTTLDRRGLLKRLWHGMVWRIINPMITLGMGDQMRVYARKI